MQTMKSASAMQFLFVFLMSIQPTTVKPLIYRRDDINEELLSPIVNRNADNNDNQLDVQGYPIHDDCPAGFMYITSAHGFQGCYKLINDNLEWLVAQLRCRSLHKNAHLLAIQDVDEQTAVARFLSRVTAASLNGCWTYPSLGAGLYTAGQRIDLTRGGSTFVWKVPPKHGLMGTDMLEFTYTNWDPGQPNDPASPCMYLFPARDSKWHDYLCSIPACSICEIDL